MRRTSVGFQPLRGNDGEGDDSKENYSVEDDDGEENVDEDGDGEDIVTKDLDSEDNYGEE